MIRVLFLATTVAAQSGCIYSTESSVYGGGAGLTVSWSGSDVVEDATLVVPGRTDTRLDAYDNPCAPDGSSPQAWLHRFRGLDWSPLPRGWMESNLRACLPRTASPYIHSGELHLGNSNGRYGNWDTWRDAYSGGELIVRLGDGDTSFYVGLPPLSDDAISGSAELTGLPVHHPDCEPSRCEDDLDVTLTWTFDETPIWEEN